VSLEKRFSVEYLAEAQDDLDKLDGSVRVIVLKAIDKVSKNPLPENECGYGKALEDTAGTVPFLSYRQWDTAETVLFVS
jgi:mRNA-degrading endonuclease RelE of RelBE toxin-antitoxin system